MCDLIQKCDSCECVTYVTCVSDVWFLCDICNVHSDAWLNFNVLLHSDVWLMWMCDFCDALFGCLLRAWQRRSSMWRDSHVLRWLLWRVFRCVTYMTRNSDVPCVHDKDVFLCVTWLTCAELTPVTCIQMCESCVIHVKCIQCDLCACNSNVWLLEHAIWCVPYGVATVSRMD